MRGVRYRLVLVLLVTSFIGVTFAFARSERVRSEPAVTQVDQVVLFTIPHIGIDDVEPDVMPVLSRLAARGAIAATNVRTKGDSPDTVDAYATLGAGNRVAIGHVPPTDVAGEDDHSAPSTSTTPPSEPVVEEPAIARRIMPTATDIGGSIVVPEMGELLEHADAGNDPGAQPGSLAEALRRAGLGSAVVTNADVLASTTPAAVVAPAAVAAADRDGLIDRGSVSFDLLRTDAVLPGVVTADPARFAAAVNEAIAGSEVVVVDPGETTRASTTVGLLGDSPAAEEIRTASLGRTDAVLGAIVDDLGPRTLLLVVGISPPGDRWALTPMVMTGAGTPRGYLHSSSTHRPDLVTLTDVAPTVLDVLGVEHPAAMIGNPLAFRPGDANWAGALALDELLARRWSMDRPMAIGFIAVQAVVYLLAIALLATDRPRRPWIDRAMAVAVLTCASWPLATFWLRIAPSLYGHGVWTFVLCWLVAGTVALGVSRFRGHVLDPVLALCTLTVATIVVDLATGAHLQYGSFFGYTPNVGARFIGIGNAAFALLGGAAVMICTSLVARARHRQVALWGAGSIAAVVVIADGAPWLGTDVGGILTLVPVLGLLLWALSGRPVRWHTIGLAVVLGAVVLGLAVGLESLRDPTERTHIGRFFLGQGEASTVQDTMRRKWAANTAILRRSAAAWLVPMAAGAALIAVASGRAWRRVLPVGSPERIGVVATLALGFVGWLLNDSGVVVLALASVFLGPYLFLLAQDRVGSAPADETAPDTVVPPMGGDQESAAEAPDVPGAVPVPAPELPAEPLVVALVPAKDRADTVAATVEALLALGSVDRVLVIDDGSSDGTAETARRCGADVLVLPINRGKGGAVAAGVYATPDADVYLLIDADLASTAAAADVLLGPVLAGDADLVVGVLPSAGGKAGFGMVRDLAARGIQRACGLAVRAPLSGQRAVRSHLLRPLESAERFGLEVAMTIDVVRRGGRVVEVDVPMDHRHTGRSLAGFAHRGRQGLDIARALWPRLVDRPKRIGVVAGITAVVCAFAVLLGTAQVPTTAPLGSGTGRVLVFGMQPLSFDDLDRGVTPNLQRMIDGGAVGAMSARTVIRAPDDGEGYLTLGAGARLRGGGLVETVLPRDEPVATTTAAGYIASFTGTDPQGDYVVMGGAALIRRNTNAEAASHPGALGDTIHEAGMSSAVVGNGDQPATFTSEGYLSRPAALAVMRSDMGVDRGHLDPDAVLELSADAPFGVRADSDAVVEATLAELDRSELVVVDPGDLARADRFRRIALDDIADRQWEQALERTDETLGRIVASVDDDTLVLVVSVVPSGSPFRPTPLVAWGSGVPHGLITSPSTRQSGLSAITDLAPTILDALGIDRTDLPGNAIRYEPGAGDIDHLKTLDVDTIVREATYGPVSSRYVNAFNLVYGLALLLIVTRRTTASSTRWLRGGALALASFPVATFLVRLIPGLTSWFTFAQAGVATILALAIGIGADRLARRPLSALSWVAGLTVGVIVVDSWTGSHLHVASWLGYSAHNAGRFYGIPNTTFAVLGGLTLVLAGVFVHQAQRRTESVWYVCCLFTVVLVSAGLPMLGADVGSLITLFPVFAVTLIALSGRQMRLRSLVVAGVAMVALVGLVAGIDLARPPDQRSHLGRFTDELITDGPAALVDTFSRKQSANLRLLGVSQWRQMIPVAVLFIVVPLAWQRRYRDVMPKGSALRVTFWSVVAATILGFASNDSGPIVISLFLAQLVPFLLLLLLAPDDEPTFLPSGPPAPRPLGDPAPEPTGASAEASGQACA